MKKAQGLSESEVVVNLVQKALQIDGDVQYGAMLRPVIQDQIHKDIQSYSNRNANINSLLLDSGVVELTMSYNPIFVIFSS